MAAMTSRSQVTERAKGGKDGGSEGGKEGELVFHNDAVSICLLVNRRQRTLRVIDFRAGPTLAKRNFVIATAKREGIEKVFVLVERDEVTTWMRLGLRREGNIAGFYKRSDAWLMGAVVSEVGPMRPEAEFDDDELGAPDEPNLSLEAANKVVEKAKKLAKELVEKSLPTTKIAPMKKDAVIKAIKAADAAGKSLTAFEPFSRDTERVHHLITGAGRISVPPGRISVPSGKGASAKGGSFEVVTGYELQPSFGSVFFELLTAPKDEAERVFTLSAIHTLCTQMVDAGAVNGFTIVPADDLGMATALFAAGFRKNAVLASHVIVGGVRKDAAVWTKRLVGEN